MKTVNDAIHGMIEIPRFLHAAMATRLFQRLHRVAQCGNLRLAWPSAAHTRFAHSVGTAHLADEYSRRLAFRPRLRRAFGLAALLHDVGHGPFSHVFEMAIEGTATAELFGDHDAWRFRLIVEDAELREALGDLGGDVAAVWADEPKMAAGLTDGEVRVAHALLAGVAGVDRLDYLLRDSYHTSPQHRIDRTAIQAIMLHTVADLDGGTVRYTPKGEHYVNLLLEARLYMFSEVYLHPRVVSADRALAAGFRHGGIEARARELLAAGQFERLTDGWIEQQATEAPGNLIRDALANRAEQLAPCAADDPREVLRLTCEGVRPADNRHVVNRFPRIPDIAMHYKPKT